MKSFAGIALLGALISASLVATADTNPAFAPLPSLKHPIAVIAHRAGAGIMPENTLAAIRNAIHLGVDYVELDIRATSDGQLVIMHDGSVDRTTNGKGAVKQLDFSTIRALDAGSKFHVGEYAGEKVSTFDEVLELCHGKVHIYVDHKEAPTTQMFEAIKKYGMEKEVVVYNGTHALQEWKKVAPHIPVMPSLPTQYRKPGGVAEFEKELAAEVVDGNLVEWTKELVDQCHALGVKVYVDNLGPNDNLPGFKKAIEIGVDGIQTNYPDLLLAYLTRQLQRRFQNERTGCAVSHPGNLMQNYSLHESLLYLRYHLPQSGRCHDRLSGMGRIAFSEWAR